MLIFVAGQLGTTMQAMGMSLNTQTTVSCHCKCGGDSCCVDASQPDTPETPATPPQTETLLKISLLTRMIQSFHLAALDTDVRTSSFAPPLAVKSTGIPAYTLFCSYLI
jgi:hypothetical protein